MKLICFHCLHSVIIFYSQKVDCNIAKEERTDSEHFRLTSSILREVEGKTLGCIEIESAFSTTLGS